MTLIIKIIINTKKNNKKLLGTKNTNAKLVIRSIKWYQ